MKKGIGNFIIMIVAATGFVISFVISLITKSPLAMLFVYTFFLFTICMCVVVAYNAPRIKEQKLREKLSPKTELATVKSRSAPAISYRYSTRTNYFVTFETQFGHRMCFEVKQEEYAVLLEDDSGLLTYKEGEGKLFFESFKRN